MAYQMYITEALVCGNRDSNTSDRAYLLFTREAGMLFASARSVREERSKQRYALQDFSHIRVTLVRGKGGWRIAGVEPLTNLYFTLQDRETRTLVRNVLRFLKRVVGGETPQPELFDYVIGSLTEVGKDTQTKELLMSLRILKELGYVAPNEKYDALLEHSHDADTLVLSADEERWCAKTVEHALLNSQL